MNIVNTLSDQRPKDPPPEPPKPFQGKACGCGSFSGCPKCNGSGVI